MEELKILIERLLKIGIKIELIGNYPWVYLDKVNGNKVKEIEGGNHGLVIAFVPVRIGNKTKFEIERLFKYIRKYR